MHYKQTAFWIANFIFGAALASFDCRKILTGTTSSRATISGTYNLCDFVIGPETKDGWYAAYDNRTVGNIELHGGDAVNYTFYFNIAANIAKPTPNLECDNYNRSYRQIHGLEIGYCRDIRSAGMINATCANELQNIVPIQQMTAAYQSKFNNYESKCWRLHDGLTEPIWTFLDSNNPALGVQLTYINGDWCQAFGKNREFKITFICSNDITITPSYIETIFEPIDSGCSYEFEMKTYRGCPVECPVYNDALCSGHGVCDYDWNIGTPKCFCYCGWDGNACSIATNDDCSVQYNNKTDNDNNGCQFELTDTNGMTAEYDLSYFHLQHDIFRVIDSQNTYFEYVFNICGAIDPQVMIDNRTIPEVCTHPNSNHGPCIRTHQEMNSTIPVCNEENGYENTAGMTPSALQIDSIDNDTKQCYWLGMEISLTDHMPEYKIELLNPNDAGKGVIFTILNGEWCSSVGRNREFKVKLECPDDNRIEFEPSIHQTQISAGVVNEIDTCVYERRVVSPNACPTKCISRMNLEMFATCATHGICVADPYARGISKHPNGTVRCLCDEGYTGTTCENAATTYSPNKPTNETTNNPNQQSANSKKTDSHMIVIWILIGAVVILVSIVLFYAYQNRKNKRLVSDFVLFQAEDQQSSINQAEDQQRDTTFFK